MGKEKGFRVIYYISPQVWAWKESRVKSIRQVVDKMLVILPFEKDFFEKKWEYIVEFVGHPLVEVVNDFLAKGPGIKKEEKIIALLPGSRKQEISKKLPIMLEVSKAFPGYQFVVAKAASLEDDFYTKLLSDYPGVSFVTNETYALLSKATAALVTSGTATLETALFGVPQVVCYKGSTVSYQIAKRLVKIKYISLVNLIMEKEVVKELIQDELTVTNLTKELDSILHDHEKIGRMKNEYAALKTLLHQQINASEKAATIIVNVARATSL